MTLALTESGDRLDVERAADWLRKCRDAVQVREVRDKARTIEFFYRERSASLAAQQDAAEIALRAERRLGEFCKERVRRGGDRRKAKSQRATLSLGELGISKGQSSRWQKLAAIPEDHFERHVVLIREKGEKATTAGTIRAASHAPDYDGDEWGTPPGYIEAAREVLGGIDLDPASNDRAQGIVRADEYYTKAENGLTKPWHGRVWMNPPYSQPSVSRFVERFINAYEEEQIHAGIVLVNNATDANWCQALLRRFPACFPEKRVAFLGRGNVPVPGTRQGQVVFYAGEYVEAFAQRFISFGAVHAPWGWAF